MNELGKINRIIDREHPTAQKEVLLVLDATTGQNAITQAKLFQETVGVTGIILTKLDGDARGGAALSIRAVTDKPIKFVALGEKLDQLEPFHPDRMASRILGMGDVLSLIEKAQAGIDEKKAMEMERKMRTAQFTLDDFLDQLDQMKNMGPLDEILGMIPGMNSKALKGLNVDNKDLVKIEAIIKSMTKKERDNPDLIDSSRRKRIANGSGTQVQDVNKLLKQFKETKKMMKKFSEMSKSPKKKGKLGFPFF